MKPVQYALGLGLAVMSAVSFAHPPAGPDVVPAAERERDAAKAFSGPTQNRGVESVTLVGSVALGSEFEGVQGRVLRAREIVVAPGGVVAVHEHHQRPGLAYILEGEIIEHRNDADRQLVRRAGDAAFERTGVVHWWENRSDKPARALVVDIVPES